MTQLKVNSKADRWVCRVITFAVFGIFIISQDAIPQDTASVFRYPSAANVHIKVSCNVSSSNGGFHYSFDVRSEENSQQKTEAFFVDVGSTITAIKMPDLWLGSISATRKALMWFSRDSLRDIMPGGRNDRFGFTSPGLPAIAVFYAVGHVPIPEFPFGQTPDSIVGNDVFGNSFRGITLTALDPAGPFFPQTFIDTLLSYARESVDLGWLGTSRDDDCDNDEHPQDGIEKNIERRLTLAQRDLQKGDSIKARKDLELLVNKVDRIWKRGQMIEKKHEHDRGDWWQHRKDWVVMTSEAYALLKYNTEYLIDRLPERERHEGRGKKEQ
jgi:hypothetical protein